MLLESHSQRDTARILGISLAVLQRGIAAYRRPSCPTSEKHESHDVPLSHRVPAELTRNHIDCGSVHFILMALVH
jgi:hypothetical protein